MTTKKTSDYEYDHKDPVADDPDPVPPVPTFLDGDRPVYIRLDAIDAFYGLGQPVNAYRLVLRGGEAIIVNATDLAKTAHLKTLG
jgi:hypothetical protein